MMMPVQVVAGGAVAHPAVQCACHPGPDKSDNMEGAE